jgi:hypothetical protein
LKDLLPRCLEISAKERGIKKKRASVFKNSIRSIRIVFPIKSSRYKGKSTICMLRFIGIKIVPKATSPLAELVNVRNQSVHGITKYIRRPRSIAGSLTNPELSRHVNTGTKIKFTARLNVINLLFFEASMMRLKGIFSITP